MSIQRHLGSKPYLLSDHTEAGYNQRMTDLQRALGAAQMKRANQIISERRSRAATYNDAFSDIDWLQTPIAPSGYGHGYQSYPCPFEPKVVMKAIINKDLELLNDVHKRRNEWMEELQKIGISTRPATHAVHMLNYYREKYNAKPEQYPASHSK